MSSTDRWLLQGVDRVARHQLGVITRSQAIGLLGLGATERWLSDGRLVLEQPGTYRLLGSPRTWPLRLNAAVLSSGGVASHRSAAELWGLIDPAEVVEVAIPAGRRSRLRPPAVVHRIRDLRPGLAVFRAGILVTDPQRTLVDLGLTSPRWEVSRALTTAISSKLLTIQDVVALRDALARPGRNGTGVLRQVLADRLPTIEGEESHLEARLVDLLAQGTIPRPVLQHEVWDAGRFVARLDAAYPDVLLAVEADGFRFHSSPEALQRDHRRQNQLVALGWTVLRFTSHDVRRRRPHLLHTVEDTYRRLRLCARTGA